MLGTCCKCMNYYSCSSNVWNILTYVNICDWNSIIVNIACQKNSDKTQNWVLNIKIIPGIIPMSIKIINCVTVIYDKNIFKTKLYIYVSYNNMNKD